MLSYSRDVHTHIGNEWKTLDEVLELRRSLQEQLHVDLAELRKRYQGRIQFCISDYTIKDGLRFSPQELVHGQEQGVMGFKFYPGWQRGVQIDQAANDPTFDKMEQLGMVATSPHVANPCGTFGRRTEWFSEPVEFWRQQHAWENVLEKIYFRNALRIYPHLAEVLTQLGYFPKDASEKAAHP